MARVKRATVEQGRDEVLPHEGGLADAPDPGEEDPRAQPLVQRTGLEQLPRQGLGVGVAVEEGGV